MVELMRALQYVTVGEAPRIMMVPKPHAGPGQVVVKVSAAGVCHSDAFLMSRSREVFDARGWKTPMTLGHEGAGIVHELGAGVTEFTLGDAVAIYGPWGCGSCSYCQHGNEMLCPFAKDQGIKTPGIGAPGAMAEFILIHHPRHLVALGSLDPVSNVALTDAGLTPYHAIKNSLSKLGAGSTAVIIGVGGLGHLAIPLLRVLTATTIVALDIREEKLLFARERGADRALMINDQAAEEIRIMTGGIGANAVFDFVGTQSTVELGAKLLGPDGDLHIIGLGGGMLPVGFGATAYDVTVRTPHWGSLPELVEIIALAKAGKISAEFEEYRLEDGPAVYERLHAGDVRGRAVLVP